MKTFRLKPSGAIQAYIDQCYMGHSIAEIFAVALHIRHKVQGALAASSRMLLFYELIPSPLHEFFISGSKGFIQAGHAFDVATRLDGTLELTHPESLHRGGSLVKLTLRFYGPKDKKPLAEGEFSFKLDGRYYDHLWRFLA